MTERPDITPSNYKAVYDYYDTSRLNKRFNKALFRCARALYAPNVVASEETIETITTSLALGKGALLAVNHPSGHDPFVTAGAFDELAIDGFQEFTGFAKDELFRGASRPIFELTGCVPVFRQKNYEGIDLRQHAKITERLFQLASNRLRSGQNVSLMPEGTNSSPDELTVLPIGKIKSGIVKIAQYASDNHSFIVPVGVHYKSPDPKHAKLPRHASVAFGEPITHYETNPIALKRQIHAGMQDALTAAVERTHE